MNNLDPVNASDSHTRVLYQNKKFLFIVGCLLLLFAAILFLWEQNNIRTHAFTLAAENQSRTNAYLNEQKLRAAAWSKALTSDLGKANKNEALAKQNQYSRFWHGTRISLFDKDDKIITEVKNETGGDLASLNRNIFESALLNAVDVQLLRQRAKTSGYEEAYTRLAGDVYFLTVNRPKESAVGTLIVAIPLDASLCKEMHSITRAHFALVSPEQLTALAQSLGISELHDQDIFSSDLSLLANTIKPGTSSSLYTPLGSGNAVFTIALLPQADASTAAGVIAIPPLPEAATIIYAIAAAAFVLGLLTLLWGFLHNGQGAFDPTKHLYHRDISRSKTADDSSVRTTSSFMENAQLEVHKLMHSMLAQSVEQTGRDYQLFFDNSPLGLFHCSGDGKLLHINQTFAAMLGYDSTVQMMTERESLLEFCRDEEEATQLLVSLKEQPSIRHSVLMQLHNGKQRVFWIVSIASYKMDRSASIDGFLMDRTQEKQLEDCLAQRDALMDSNQSLALLLASTCKQSHTFCSVPRNSQPLENGGKERRQGTISLQAILDDIGQIALAEADAHVVFASPIDLPSLLKSIETQLMPALSQQSVQFAYSIEVPLLQHVTGFSPLVRHALLRAVLLLTNDTAGGNAHITVTTQTETALPNTAGLMFTISWEGQEDFVIRPASAEEQTIRTEAAAADAASVRAGLSRAEELKILQYLVQHLNGELVEGADTDTSRSLYLHITLDQTLSPREEQEFGTFTSSRSSERMNAVTDEAENIIPPITIPLEGDAAPRLDLLLVEDDAITPEEPLQEETREDPAQGLDILLVEDSLNNRLLFSLYLRDTPHRITEAENGEEGVEIFQQKNFDVVFMDMEMPLMDGYQATRIIRAYEADTGRDHVPIVAQTAHVLPEFKNQCMLAGCTEFLSKPFSKNALHMMLATFIEKKHEQQKTDG